MFGWFLGRKLGDAVNETKKVRIKGVYFVIRKIDVLSYLDGSKVLLQTYDTHKTEAAKAKANAVEVNQEKLKKHLSEVIVAGVVSPKISFKEEPGAMLVDRLFVDIELIDALYLQIMQLTYGKKKVQLFISQGKSLLNLT